jgi:predicted kinase
MAAEQLQESISDTLSRRRYNPHHVPEPEQVVLTIGGRTIGTLQNFVVYSGLPKAGKSTFIAATLASALMPGDQFGIKIGFPENRRRVCFFDTESSDYDFYRQINKIKRFSHIDVLPDVFDAYKVREDHPKQIKDMIEQYLQLTPECSVMVIDGFLDLLLNFNDEIESRMLINWLKRLTKQYNCLIIGVLHLGKKDGHTLGHLGSMVDRYTQSLLKITKDKEQLTYSLTAEMMRSDVDFLPVVLKNIDGVWYDQSATINELGENLKQKKELTIQEHQQKLFNVFNYRPELSYKELVQNIAEEYIIGTNKAKQLVAELKNKNLIQKNLNNDYIFNK